MRLEQRVLLDADPVAAIGGAGDTDFINETTEISVTFDNQGAATGPGDDGIGYGPFLDLTLQSGIENPSASFAGTPVALDEIATWERLPDDSFAWVRAGGDPTDPADVLAAGDHPLGAAIPLPDAPTAAAAEGTTWYQVVAPFGSFGPDQPALTFELSADLDQAASPGGAVVDEPLDITARPGFRFGNDALNNPSDDPPVVGTTQTDTITPTVYQIDKAALPPADTTPDAVPAGPNFPYQFRIAVDVAAALDPATPIVENLVVTDALPAELVYTGNNSLTVNGVDLTGSLNFDPATAEVETDPLAVLGTAATDEVVILIEAYTPETAQLTGVVETQGGDLVTNDAFRALSFDNLAAATADYRETPGAPLASLDPIDDGASVTAVPASIEKTASVVGGGAPVPGATISYTHDIYVSDFVVLSDVPVTDTLDDGLSLDNASLLLDPTPSDPVGGDEITLVPGSAGVSVTTDAANRTVLAFDLVAVTGGAPIAGDLALDAVQSGAIHYRLTYQATVQDTRSDGSPIRAGDELTNSASLEATGDGVVGPPVADGGTATVGIESVTAAKQVLLINGVDPAGDLEIKAGDEVTFVVEVRLPIGDVDSFALQDYPPLPIFDVDQIDAATAWRGQLAPGVAPAAGEIAALASLAGQPGADPADFSGGAAPVVGVDGGNNAFRLDFGDLEDPTNAERRFFIAYTLAVADEPFADGLSLTNQSVTSGADSNGDVVQIVDIEQVVLRQPELTVQKGVVAATSGADKLTGNVGPAVFAPPTTTGPALVADLTAASIAGDPVDADAERLDAGDVVRFALTIQNTGGEPAVDISLTDDLAPLLVDGIFGLYDPTPGLPDSGDEGNLRVTYGDRVAASFDASTFFVDGRLSILDDRAFDPGSPGDLAGLGEAGTTGSDVLVVTYDLVVLDTTPTAFSGTNTATLDTYGAVASGTNFLDGIAAVDRPNDAAELAGAAIGVAKSVGATSLPASAGDSVAIGELVEYTAAITLPEGAFAGGLVIEDDLPAGVQFVGAATPPAGQATVDFDNLAAGAVLVDLAASYVGPPITFTGAGGPVTLAAGESGLVQVTPTGDAEPIAGFRLDAPGFTVPGSEQSGIGNVVTLTYVTRPVDATGPGDGDTLANTVTVDPADAPSVSAAAQVAVVEPVLDPTKRFTDAAGNDVDTISAGERVYQRFQFSNAGTDASLYFTDDATDAPALLDDSLAGLVVGGNALFTVVGARTDLGSDARFTLDAAQAGAGIIQFDPAAGGGDVELTAGAALELVVELQVAPDAPIGRLVTNTATATGFSAPAQAVDEQPAIGRETRTYGETAVDSVRVDAVELTKTIVSTSVGGDTSDEVVIGEVVTFDVEIAIPDGSAARIEVGDIADAGLVVDPASVVLVDASTDVVLGPVTLTPTAAGFDLVLEDVVNPPAVANDDVLVVRLDARVANIAANQDGTRLENRATHETFTTATQPVPTDTGSVVRFVDVVEPDLAVTKGAAPTAGVDAGDTVRFTVSLEHTAASTADAFDVELVDRFDPTLDLVPATVSIVDAGGTGLTAADFVVVGDELRLAAGVDFDLGLGETFTFTYDATVTTAVTPQQSLANTVEVTWTSIDGVDPDERTGAGGVDDYLDDATVSVVASDGVAVDKTVVPGRATIGDDVTYVVEVTLIEGTNPSVVVTDAVPSGLTDVAIASVEDSAGNAVGFAGGVQPDGSLSFDFGDVVLPGDNDPANDALTITYTARLDDDPANASGTRLVNTASVTSAGAVDTATAELVVLEPDLITTKSANTGAANPFEPITYTVTVAHSGNSTADAFDLVIEDRLLEGLGLDDKLDLIVGTVTTSVGTVVEGNTAGDRTVRIEAPALALADAPIVVTFDAELNANTLLTDTVTNTAGVAYDTIAGSDPNQRGYSDDDTATVLRPLAEAAPGIVKTITASSDRGVSGTQPLTELTIGETVDYEVRATFAVGSYPAAGDVQIVDLLPAGLAFTTDPTAADVRVGGALSGASVGAVNLVDRDGDGRNDQVTFDVDLDVVNPGSLDERAVVVDLQARVLNTTVNVVDPTTPANNARDNTAELLVPAFPSFSRAATAEATLVEPELALVKTQTAGPTSEIDAGDRLTYRVAVGHTADSTADAYGVTLADTLPAFAEIRALSVIGAPAGVTTSDFDISAGNVVTTVDPIDLAGSQVLLLDYELVILDTVEPGASLDNSARVAWTSLEGELAPGTVEGERDGSTAPAAPDDYAEEASLSVPVANVLEATKTVTNQGAAGIDRFTIGEVVDYAVELEVFEGTTPGLQLVDVLPGDLDFVGGSLVLELAAPGMTTAFVDEATSATYDVATRTLTVDLGEVVSPGDNVANDTLTLRYRAEVLDASPANENGQTKVNDAVVSSTSPALPDRSTTASFAVVEPVLVLDKTIDRSFPNLGEVVTYELTVSHDRDRADLDSTAPAFDVALRDPVDDPFGTLIPGSVAVAGATAAVVSGNAAGDTEVVVTAAELGLTETLRVTYDVQITSQPAGYGSVVVNTAQLDYDGVAGIASEQRLYTDTDQVNAQILGADLVVAKDDARSTAQPGDRLTYSITVLNRPGPFEDVAGDVILTDVLPAGTSFVSATAGSFDPAARTLTATLGDIAPGEQASITLVVDVDEPAPAGVVELLNVAEALHADPDPTPADNRAIDVDTLIARPDLTITKSDGLTEVRPGQTVTYALTIDNVGDQVASGVRVVDQLDDVGLAFVAASDAGTFDPVAREVSWDLGAISPSASPTTLTVTAEVVSPAAAGVDLVVNRASVADDGAGGADPTPGNNRAVDSDILLAAPDLRVTKTTLTPDLLVIGSDAVFEVVVANTGNQHASGVVLVDPIPAGLSFVAASDGGLLRGDEVVWRFGRLEGADQREVTVTFQVTAAARPPDVTNTALANDDGANGPDPTPEDNRDSAVVSVSVLPDRPPFGGGDGRAGGMLAEFFERRQFLDRLSPDYLIFTGVVEPGAAVTIALDDGTGLRVASGTAFADTAGNYLLNLSAYENSGGDAPPDLLVAPQPGPVAGNDFVSSRSYFAPLGLGAVTSVRDLSTEEVLARRAGAALDASVESMRSVALRTANQPYVSNLQASSATISDT